MQRHQYGTCVRYRYRRQVKLNRLVGRMGKLFFFCWIQGNATVSDKLLVVHFALDLQFNLFYGGGAWCETQSLQKILEKRVLLHGSLNSHLCLQGAQLTGVIHPIGTGEKIDQEELRHIDGLRLRAFARLKAGVESVFIFFFVVIDPGRGTEDEVGLGLVLVLPLYVPEGPQPVAAFLLHFFYVIDVERRRLAGQPARQQIVPQEPTHRRQPGSNDDPTQPARRHAFSSSSLAGCLAAFIVSQKHCPTSTITPNLAAG